MKILLVNKYFYLEGGAEQSFFQTAKLLGKKGHDIVFFSMKHPQNFPSEYEKYFVQNVDYENHNGFGALKAAGKILYSFESKKNIEQLIIDERPSIAHLNNIYHQISPSILHSFRKHNIPVVMTLRDYKLVCASYSMISDKGICEACKDEKYFQCLLKGCVKDSKMKSLLNTVEMYLHHKILHIYDHVDAFISPSVFLKNKLEEMGFKRKIIHLSNFVALEDFVPHYSWDEKTIVYFGRLSKEKGLNTLIDAMKNIDNVSLKIIGEGPLKNELEMRSSGGDLKNKIRFLGYKTGDDLKEEIRRSMFVVLPSECYENNPRTIIEGFALGKPAVGSNLGGIPELLKNETNGLLFEQGNPKDLREKINHLVDNPENIEKMGRNARMFIDDCLSAERHYERLIEIYDGAIQQKRRKES